MIELTLYDSWCRVLEFNRQVDVKLTWTSVSVVLMCGICWGFFCGQFFEIDLQTVQLNVICLRWNANLSENCVVFLLNNY